MSDKWETRRTLLQRAQDPDDHQAWEEFVLHYKPFISSTLYRISSHASEHDDLVQEILLAIWKDLADFKLQANRGSFRSWLSTLIRHRVIDHARKDKQYSLRREKATNENGLHNGSTEPEMEAVIEREWERYITQTALGSIKSFFSATAVQVFELSLKGKKAREISEQLGIKQDSVRTLKNRVKLRVVTEIQRLREELEF